MTKGNTRSLNDVIAVMGPSFTRENFEGKITRYTPVRTRGNTLAWGASGLIATAGITAARYTVSHYMPEMKDVMDSMFYVGAGFGSVVTAGALALAAYAPKVRHNRALVHGEMSSIHYHN